MSLNTVELIGYLGSILVAISLMMKSLVRLRLINLIGAGFFTLYGILLGAYPVAVLNGLIVGIDVYYLVQMWRQKDFFTFLEVSPQGAYLRAFLDFHKTDIATIIPSFRYQPQTDLLCFFVLRNMMPAGLFIVNVQGADANVQLDYVIPNYRDFQVARFIFEENAAFFAQRGIKRFISEGGSDLHRGYLEKMGFIRSGDLYTHEINEKLLKDNRF